MTYLEDLAPYTYQDDEIVWLDGRYVTYRPRYDRVAVGWLAKDHDFPVGPVSPAFVDALFAAVREPRVNVMRGFQTCFLCPASREMVSAEHRGTVARLGNAEIRIPGGPSMLYAAPSLIWHYVAVHAYAPPAPFVAAVEAADGSWVRDDWIPPDADYE